MPTTRIRVDQLLIRKATDIPLSEVTDRKWFRERRGGVALALGTAVPALLDPRAADRAKPGLPEYTKGSPHNTAEELTTYEAITTYNNFYEFATDKKRPARLAKKLRTRPWTVTVEGEIEHPKVYDIDELIQRFPLEERIYRLRCVEAWSMVIPWIGFPLGALIKTLAPTSRAKFVAFETLYDPQQMPGQRRSLFGSALDWPYIEALRIDEAMHPLTILGLGLYGDLLPNQNGAPVRLVVPWKYGFKSIKSIVRIHFVEQQPVNTWQQQAAHEYGFYANVNPGVSHPRWSQARERRIGEFRKRPTLIFNGYAEQVAELYREMDLNKNF